MIVLVLLILFVVLNFSMYVVFDVITDLLLKILRCNRGISDMAHFYKMSYFMAFAASFFFDLAHKDDGRALR